MSKCFNKALIKIWHEYVEQKSDKEISETPTPKCTPCVEMCPTSHISCTDLSKTKKKKTEEKMLEEKVMQTNKSTVTTNVEKIEKACVNV